MFEKTALLLALICTVGAVLMLLLFHHKSKKADSTPAAADLLDYAALVHEHVIALKSGALMQCFELRPADLSFADELHLEHVQSLFKKAVLKLGGNYALHFDAVRRRVRSFLPTSSNPKDLVAVFDEVKRRELKLGEPAFETVFYLTLTKLGDKRAARALAGFMTQEENRNGDALKECQGLIDSFLAECRSVTDTLSLCLDVRPLGFVRETAHDFAGELLGPDSSAQEMEKEIVCHEAVSYLYAAYAGLFQKVQIPRAGCYLDAVIAAQDLEASFTPRVGRIYHSVIAIEGVPSQVSFLILNALSALPCEYRFNTRYLTFDDLKSAFLLERYRRFWKQRERGLIAQIFNTGHGRVNLNALEKVGEIDEEKARLDSHEAMFGSYCACVIVSHEDFAALEGTVRQITRRIEDLGFGCRIETVNAMEAFLGSLPGHVEENVRRPMVNHEVLCDLLPLSQGWCGEKESPHPLIGDNKSPLLQCFSSRGRGVFYLNLHDHDLGNTIVIGPPGSGKSVLLGEIMINFMRYPKARVFAFDKGYSFYALTRAMEGEHVTFKDAKASFCPLEFLDSTEDFAATLEYCETLMRLSGLKLNASERLELSEALKLLSLRDKRSRSISDLHLLLSSRHLKEAIEPYTLKANAGSLLDALSNPAFEKPLTVFECAALFDSSQRFMVPVLKQLFRLLERSFDGNPAAIIVDEAWMMLKEPLFASELIKWFKTLRKHNVLVVLATQSLADLAATSFFEAFLDCAKTRIFLPNYDAKGEVLSKVYQTMGLNRRQIEMIAAMQVKRDYLIKKGAHCAKFRLWLTEAEQQLLSFAGDHIVQTVDERYAKYGPDLGLNLAGPKDHGEFKTRSLEQLTFREYVDLVKAEGFEDEAYLKAFLEEVA